MRKNTFYGKVDRGKLAFDHPGIVREFISNMPDGTELEVVFAKPRTDATQQQWGYLHAVVYPHCAETWGWSCDEVDSHMKTEFCKQYGIVLPGGMEFSKALLLGENREWLSKYIDHCLNVAGEQGVAVPPPKKNWKKEKKNGDKDTSD